MRRAGQVILFAAWLTGLFLTLPPHADAETPLAGRRVALVIGNGGYRNVDRLPNAGSDARLIAATLRDLHFTLIGGDAQIDLDRAHLQQAVQDFGHAIAGAEVALFYYSGHGLQVQGVNWLVPIDANPTRPQDLDFQMVDADLVLRQMDGAGTKLNLVMLDACRNNPFGNRGLRALQPGLAEMRAPEGTLISYATQPGNVAADGAGANSPYTTALAATMRRPGLDVFRMFNQVGLQVKHDTDGTQQPWVSNSPIDGDFYFVPPATAEAGASPASPTVKPAQDATAPPAPADVARETLRNSPCSVLDSRVTGPALEISGIAVRGAAWNALVATFANPSGVSRGLRRTHFDVELLPNLACGAVDALAPAIRHARTGDASRLITLPQRELAAGQRMTIPLRTPPGAHVTADLFRFPDAVEHLTASSHGDSLVIGLPATAQAGPRVLSVVVSAKPMDLPGGGDATSYLAALSAGVRNAPDAMADLAEFQLRPAPIRPAPAHPAPQAASIGAPKPQANAVRPGRCGAILERAQLGETLSDADRATLRSECR